jgi:hypothetical protein
VLQILAVLGARLWLAKATGSSTAAAEKAAKNIRKIAREIKPFSVGRCAPLRSVPTLPKAESCITGMFPGIAAEMPELIVPFPLLRVG